MKTLNLTLLVCLSAGVAAALAVQDETHAPFAALKFAPVAEKRLAGKLVATVTNGDFVHPAFSPDGEALAYAKVVRTAGAESTEISLLELNRRRTSVLLNPKQAGKYATYSAFVTEFDWLDARRLRAVIADGDVDSTVLTFDTRRKKFATEETHAGLDGETVAGIPIPAEFTGSYQKARALFPDFPAPVLKHALFNQAFLAGRRGIVLQKNHAGHERDILFLDFENRAVKTLLRLPEKSEFRLTGGLAFGGSILFVVAGQAQAYLLEHRGGELKGLMKMAYREGAPLSVEVKARSGEEVVFLLRLVPTYVEGDNPLLLFDGKNLRRAADYARLHDASVNVRTQRVAFCYWQGGRRRLTVAALKR